MKIIVLLQLLPLLALNVRALPSNLNARQAPAILVKRQINAVLNDTLASSSVVVMDASTTSSGMISQPSGDSSVQEGDEVEEESEDVEDVDVDDEVGEEGEENVTVTAIDGPTSVSSIGPGPTDDSISQGQGLGQDQQGQGQGQSQGQGQWNGTQGQSGGQGRGGQDGPERTGHFHGWKHKGISKGDNGNGFGKGEGGASGKFGDFIGSRTWSGIESLPTGQGGGEGTGDETDGVWAGEDEQQGETDGKDGEDYNNIGGSDDVEDQDMDDQDDDEDDEEDDDEEDDDEDVMTIQTDTAIATRR